LLITSSLLRYYRKPHNNSVVPLTKNITTLLFDLGGVLIELGSVSEMMATSPYNHEEIWHNWISSPSVRRFEAGLCTPEQFAGNIVEEYRLTISGDEFLTLFCKWPRGPYEGASRLLQELKRDFRIACLSNTNLSHWNHVLRDLEMMDYFDEKYLSHETGRLKPDAETFNHAIGHLGVSPDTILFFDDHPANVDIARKSGIHAELVQKPDGVVNKLNSLGIQI